MGLAVDGWAQIPAEEKIEGSPALTLRVSAGGRGSGIPAIFVPVILTASGQNNSLFTSELILTNRGRKDATLHYTYTAYRGGGSGTATDRLAPGQQKIEPDAMGYLRHLGIPIPPSGNRIGTLRVEVAGSSEVGLSVRTAMRVPEGRAGLAYPGISTAEGFTEAVYLCGLRQNSQDRSNVALQNMGTPGQGSVTLRATVFSGEASDPAPRVLDDVRLQPGGFYQYNGILNRAGLDNGYVKVERVDGRAPFYAYGVINDQVNSDGSFVFPVTASFLEGETRQVLPVIVETGAFTSELAVTNFSDIAKTVTFLFRAEAVQTADKRTYLQWTLQPGQQVIVPDIIERMRHMGTRGIGPSGPTFAGALFATVATGDMSGIVIGARTSSSDGRGGQYGVSYNAVPAGGVFTDSVWIDGLQQNEENRSNLALINTPFVDISPSVFQLDLYDGATGRLVNTVTGPTVVAGGWLQIDAILAKYAPGVTQGYVRISKISGKNPFLAYGVVNDGGAPGERSGDGAYLPATATIHDPGTEPMTDREVLAALYHATGGPDWRRRKNWLSEEPLSEWFGVETDGSGRVMRLDLGGNLLRGTIPPQLALLSQLQYLNLSGNGVSGAIPPELAQLSQLQDLFLSGTQLSGVIPPEFGGLAQLQWLDLSYNRLSGTIPVELAQLSQLRRMYLNDNHLGGAIPNHLQRLSELTKLDIRRTRICVPSNAALQAWLATLSEFRPSELVCDGSRRVFFSPRASAVREGESVTVTVSLIDQTGDPVPSVAIALETMLGGGATAADYSGVPEHITISAPANEASFLFAAVADDPVDHGETVVLGFRRPLPSGITAGDPDTALMRILDPRTEGMTDREVLAALYLAAGGPDWPRRTNWLSEAPLSEWDGVETDGSGRVTRLDLGGNGLRGTLPVALAQLSHLQGLYLSSNQLSGAIPAELGNLANLRQLNLSYNQLSGAIPAELGELAGLDLLDLHGNQLSEAIPVELGGLSQLRWLYIGANQLSGTIPVELGGLAQLQWLHLGHNRLSGAIPAELGGLAELGLLYLSGNQLSGAIPTELGGLAGLGLLDLSGNRLSGAVPAELGGLAELDDLLIGFNPDLTGTIPPELQQLSLSTLSLMATSVCVPENAALQQWLTTIDSLLPSGLICGRSPNAVSLIDVAVFFTPAARREAGGNLETEALIDLMVAETNQAYEDSGVNQQLVLVAREEVDYEEENGSSHLALSRLRRRSDGYMDEVHPIRNRTGADLVQLIADVYPPTAFLPGAFGVISTGFSPYEFAHELGHNMGLSHERYLAGGTGLLPYSYGYVNQRAFADGAPRSSRWNTIMAYGIQCFDVLGVGCSRLMRFSNPNQTYMGDPLGVPGDQRTLAVDGPADAVRALNLTRHSVASFRSGTSDNHQTTSSTLSQSRSLIRTDQTSALVPGGSLFQAIAPTVRGTASGRISSVLERATLRRREVGVDIGSLARVPDSGSTVLRLNLFDDVVLTGIIQRRMPTFSGGYALSGWLAGVAEGRVTLVVNGTVVAGTIRLPGATFLIRPAGTGRHAIMQIDPARLFWNCGTDARPH